jgi:protoporphyrinogen/coproporphyrinogen III oxidase
MSFHRQTVVIGGGITGLTCAYTLQKMGVSVALFEAADKPGGLISSAHRNGFIFEGGPQCPRFSLPAMNLIRELGLESEFLPADARAKRFIVKSGKLYPAPLSPLAFLSTPLVSLASKARLASEPLRKSHPPAIEESLADFIRRKFGTDVLDYLVDPFASAVFLSDPEEMGMESALPAVARWERETGSVIRGGIKSRNANGKPTAAPNHTAPNARVTDSLPPLGSIKSGLSALTDKLAEKLGEALHLASRVESLRQTEDKSEGSWRIRLRGGTEISAGSIVLAVPAYAASALMGALSRKASMELAGISYSPLVVVASAYERAQVRHRLDGSSVMIPRRENLRSIVTTWNSSVFPGHRAPSGKVVLTTFARVSEMESFPDLTDGAIASAVESEIAKILGISGSPIDREVWKYRHALPQFGVGHAKRIEEVRGYIREIPGLHLAGNYFQGRGIGDCVENAFAIAGDVVKELQSRGEQSAALRLT